MFFPFLLTIYLHQKDYVEKFVKMEKSFIKKDENANRAVYVVISTSVRSSADLAVHRNE